MMSAQGNPRASGGPLPICYRHSHRAASRHSDKVHNPFFTVGVTPSTPAQTRPLRTLQPIEHTISQLFVSDDQHLIRALFGYALLACDLRERLTGEPAVEHARVFRPVSQRRLSKGNPSDRATRPTGPAANPVGMGVRVLRYLLLASELSPLAEAAQPDQSQQSRNHPGKSCANDRPWHMQGTGVGGSNEASTAIGGQEPNDGGVIWKTAADGPQRRGSVRQRGTLLGQGIGAGETLNDVEPTAAVSEGV